MQRRCRCAYYVHDADRFYCPLCKQELPRLECAIPGSKSHSLVRAELEQREIDRLAHDDGWKPLPSAGHIAYSIIETRLAYGVALRIDRQNGDLIVGRVGAKANEPTQPWPSLLVALEIHLEAVTRLVEVGWHLRADFPKPETA